MGNVFTNPFASRVARGSLSQADFAGKLNERAARLGLEKASRKGNAQYFNRSDPGRFESIDENASLSGAKVALAEETLGLPRGALCLPHSLTPGVLKDLEFQALRRLAADADRRKFAGYLELAHDGDRGLPEWALEAIRKVLKDERRSAKLTTMIIRTGLLGVVKVPFDFPEVGELAPTVSAGNEVDAVPFVVIRGCDCHMRRSSPPIADLPRVSTPVERLTHEELVSVELVDADESVRNATVTTLQEVIRALARARPTHSLTRYLEFDKMGHRALAPLLEQKGRVCIYYARFERDLAAYEALAKQHPDVMAATDGLYTESVDYFSFVCELLLTPIRDPVRMLHRTDLHIVRCSAIYDVVREANKSSTT
ncbi:MAG: hypothetical protein ACRCT8_00655 [Lacipirellulaceae bacterium]